MGLILGVNIGVKFLNLLHLFGKLSVIWILLSFVKTRKTYELKRNIQYVELI
jgi:hypothetical protein